jgi:hypothetical protein
MPWPALGLSDTKKKSLESNGTHLQIKGIFTGLSNTSFCRKEGAIFKTPQHIILVNNQLDAQNLVL